LAKEQPKCIIKSTGLGLRPNELTINSIVKITGRVTDENGNSIAGANLKIFVGETNIAGLTSAEDGRFEFSTETDYAGHRLKAVVTKEGFERLSEEIRPGVDAELLFRLKKPPVVKAQLPPTLKVEPPPKRKFPWWIAIVLALICIGVASLLLPHPPKKFEVPQVTGMPFNQAVSALERVGLHGVEAGRRIDPRPSLLVIEQMPRPPALVVAGDQVSLTVSSGPTPRPGPTIPHPGPIPLPTIPQHFIFESPAPENH
jgi:hypothetical protein